MLITKSATEELRACTSHAYASRFFLKIGQAGRAQPKRDEMSLPLFGLPLILECEGKLARDYQYLARCEALIRGVSLEMA